MEDLSILVIDENRIRAQVIEAGLRGAGHERVDVVHDVNAVARRIEQSDPDVIIIDLENPNRDKLDSLFALSRALKRPIAMFVDGGGGESIQAAIDAGVSAYVVDGLREDRVKPVLDLAVTRFAAFSRMARELEEARNELATRKVVDEAKRILMNSRGLTEAEAYRLLRRTAMDSSKRIGEVADSLVTSAKLLGQGGTS